MLLEIFEENQWCKYVFLRKLFEHLKLVPDREPHDLAQVPISIIFSLIALLKV